MQIFATQVSIIRWAYFTCFSLCKNDVLFINMKICQTYRLFGCIRSKWVYNPANTCIWVFNLWKTFNLFGFLSQTKWVDSAIWMNVAYLIQYLIYGCCSNRCISLCSLHWLLHAQACRCLNNNNNYDTNKSCKLKAQHHN